MKTSKLSIKLAVLIGCALLTVIPGGDGEVLEGVKSFSVAPQSASSGPAVRRRVSFEPNVGQTDRHVRFLAHAGSGTIYLTTDEAVLAFAGTQVKKGPARHSSEGGPSVMRMKICDASLATQPASSEPDLVRMNYYLGADAGNWHENVPTYRRVTYSAIYPSIDLVYHAGEEGNLQYDFEVAPGGDHRKIQLQFGGDVNEKTAVATDGDGNLIISVQDRVKLKWKKPFAYQRFNGAVKQVSASYALLGNDCVGFSIGSFDHNAPLVIDPVLSYSTYLGGTGTDDATGVAVDSSGNAWVTGYTTSTNFPVAGSPYQGTINNSNNSPDAFVSKFSPSGALLYSTYFGGTDDDLGAGITIDNSGNPWITGRTRSTNFPATGSPAQTTNAGGGDAFVAKFSASGSLLYSSYLGGSGDDEAATIAVDGSGNVWISGDTASTDFRTAGNPAIPANRGGIDAFAARFSAFGALLYSTYLGGAGDDLGYGVGVDSSGSAWITGTTASTDFPTAGAAAQTSSGGLSDAFVVKLSATGSLIYSTYFGGVNDDNGFAIGVDTQGNAWVAGDTGSPNLPTTSGAYRTSYPGLEDAFVAKFGTSGALLYSTYLGGSGLDAAYGIAIAPAGDVFVTGFTTSSDDFPLSPNPFQSTHGGGIQDAFITKFLSNGTLSYSTFIGGAAVEEGNAVAVSSSNQVWFAGYATSSDFPVAGNPFQVSGGGNSVDGFVAKLDGNTSPTGHSLLNISTRVRVDTAENVLIGGFIVQGTKPKRVILRAIGPSLSGVPPAETLQNPTLELHDGTGAIVISNDNWKDGPQKQAIIDTTIPPQDDRESAVVAALNSGSYTAIVRGSGGTTGVAVVELYDIDAVSSSEAVNISTRGRVETGGNVMIGGFILGGTTPTRVIVRAIGPSLNGSVAGALQDPILELRDGNGGVIRSNDNWRSDQEAEIIATTIPPTNNLESAIVATLPANGAAYTAIVRGVNGTQGVALVEVYKLN